MTNGSLDISWSGIFYSQSKGDTRSCIIYCGVGFKLWVFRFYLWPCILYKIMKYCPSEHFGEVVWSQQDRYVIMSMTSRGWKYLLTLMCYSQTSGKRYQTYHHAFFWHGAHVRGITVLLIPNNQKPSIFLVHSFWSLIVCVCVQACLTAWGFYHLCV